jgi:hypothetical protein
MDSPAPPFLQFDESAIDSVCARKLEQLQQIIVEQVLRLFSLGVGVDVFVMFGPFCDSGAATYGRGAEGCRSR